MINLEKISGLPIELKEDLRIKFNPPMDDREPTYIRKFSEMVPVLKDPKLKISTEEMYIGYRKLSLPKDQQIVDEQHLEYDLTIIPPLMLGDEFNKTLGHYHGNIPGSNVAHPELYEILHGSALIILQKMDFENDRVISFIVTEAKTGDKVVYPPNYGHILVNIGSDCLVTANWLSINYKPLYEPVSVRKGMAYYVVKDSKKGFDFMPNKNYGTLPGVRLLSRHFMANFPITSASKPMYTQGMYNPLQLEFLNNPEKYAVELSTITS